MKVKEEEKKQDSKNVTYCNKASLLGNVSNSPPALIRVDVRVTEAKNSVLGAHHCQSLPVFLKHFVSMIFIQIS